MDVTLLYFNGCPHWEVLDQRLRALAGELGFTVAYQRVETPDAAEQWQFRGSPSLLVDGSDPFAREDGRVGLTCRIYQTPQGPAGAPTSEQLRAVLGGTGELPVAAIVSAGRGTPARMASAMSAMSPATAFRWRSARGERPGLVTLGSAGDGPQACLRESPCR